jgi:CDGSH-type Zn-finger protein
MVDDNGPTGPSITSRPGGPLMVSGDVPLVRKTAVHSEHGEPLAWKTGDPIETRSTYVLCRCGGSANKPFCDGSHSAAGFEGADTVDGSSYAERSNELGGTAITVSDDRSICVHAGFCGTRVTNIWKSVAGTEESTVRLAVINMVEKCPSGALTYRFDGDEGDTEPDYATQVGVIDDGPLWVTGAIPVTTSGGTELEPRARVTLCRCGHSANKPLCDGSHKEAGFTDAG